MKTPIIALASLFAMATANAQPGVAVDQDGNGVASSDDDIPMTEAKARMTFKLEDLVGLAVRLSPDLARARVDRTTAWHQAAASRHTMAWTLTANAQYSQNGTGAQIDVPLYGIDEQDTLSAAIGLGRNLPIGGSITFNAGVQHQHTEYTLNDTVLQESAAAIGGSGMAPPPEDSYNVQTSVGVTYKQPLVRGLGSIAMLDVHRAELQATQATLKAQLAAEDMLKDLVTSYWELAYSSYEVDVRYKALELAEKQSDLTHEQIRVGAVQQSALGSVDYEVATRKDALLQAETDLEKQSLEMRQKVGLEVHSRDVVLHPDEDFNAEHPIADEEFDAGEVLENGRARNRKLATIDLESKLADLDVDAAADAAKPQIDLQLSAAVVGEGQSIGESFSGVGTFDGYQIGASLNMSFELSGAARRSRDAASAKRRRIEIDRADTLRQLESETTLAIKKVETARSRVELETKARQVAEENVRDARISFISGKMDNFKVLEQQQKLTDARLKLGRAIADYHIAVCDLQYLSGFLLPQYGVDVRVGRQS